jgi:hypothetical protein
MDSEEIWIRDGRMVARPIKHGASGRTDKYLLDQLAMVRVTFKLQGSVIQWNMSRPNWSSLMFASHFLAALPAPYTFKYFNAGWFTETHDDINTAVPRFESLIFKSDVRLSDRAYTSVVVPDFNVIPDTLRLALLTGTAPQDRSIVCNVEPDREISRVEHVGRDSLIARVWGVSPNSFPCLNGHSYDRAVTPEYFKVVQTGKPHYDHVLASLVLPDGERHWYGYHRVILPDLTEGRKRVRVLSEFAPVDIQLL